MEYYIGVMSGTSMDGIDTVLVGIENEKLETIASYSTDFPSHLKAELEALIGNYQTDLEQVGRIDHQLGNCYADAINQLIENSKIDPAEITAIGCHGQTVFHQPEKPYTFTMQLGDANLIAAKTGVRTVADFRRMDMANGGGGAPLAPAFHQYFLNSPSEKRCILNLGGIANITILDQDDNRVIGFDTGPANCLMNNWVKMKLGKEYDEDGQWAENGTVIPELLDHMLSDEYFQLPHPKTTGRELFNLNWLNQQLENFHECENEDIQATLLELTAKTVALSIQKAAPDTDTVYVCGGGANNSYLLKRLEANLNGQKVFSTNKIGILPQLVESTAFAWLAMRRIKGLHGNLPSVTGANSKVLLGTIYDPATF